MGKKHEKTPPALKKAAENKRYVSAVHGDKIYYTKEFYRAMYCRASHSITEKMQFNLTCPGS